MTTRYPSFTQCQQATIKRSLGIPISATAFKTNSHRLAISDLHHELKLSPVPFAQFLGPDCWLMGGSVLKWLHGLPMDPMQGDYDFFFPSLHALNTTVKAMMKNGARVRGYRAFAQNIREYLRAEINSDKNSEIWKSAGNLVELTPALVTRLRLVYLELSSPEGYTLQLVASCNHPSAVNLVVHSDFSICQLALDDKYLYFGSFTWSDLFKRRIRCENNDWPESSFRRMFRYSRRGYWPYLSTALSLSAVTLAQGLTYPLRYSARHWDCK